ncbi:glycosyl transferase [Loa loa]|uniref:Alpha-1,3/1,6-mannosyltransferase ALG2 n=1 Tax=Loa loa TaxID=7209 RepID=A0A1S0U6W5_LOALO|nr:glycosyl transferase [Loa loa]EFO26127.2 glycosyl transferase [Loa loa]
MLVVILHPEQWNGGSDRCTLGMIKHFVELGHRVIWYTTMIDCYWNAEEFDNVEIRNANLPLHPGDWWTQNVVLALQLIFSGLVPDLVVIDHSARYMNKNNYDLQHSCSCLPMLKWRFPKVKILFYCHFPQQLVTPTRFFLYRWYSRIIGLIEGLLFQQADLIMVNSHFTESQFLRVMPEVNPSRLIVVYPPCDVDAVKTGGKPISRTQRQSNNKRYTFLSINRFWPEKKLDIIIQAAALIKRNIKMRPRIVLAGSVMPYIPESFIYYNLLQKMVRDLKIIPLPVLFHVDDIVEFVKSPTDPEKFALYRECDTVLYTPPNEHFGIVPLEALQQRRPVIVCNSGGPAETVVEGVTGSKIAAPQGKLLAIAMEEHMKRTSWPALDNDDIYEHQRKRFEQHFSLNEFCNRINDALDVLFPDDPVMIRNTLLLGEKNRCQ